MEENELYSSTTTGERAACSLAAVPRVWWGGHAAAAAESSCSVVAPSPGQSPYRPLCITSGYGPRWRSLAGLHCQPSTLGSLPLAQALLVGEGRAEGTRKVLLLILCHWDLNTF